MPVGNGGRFTREARAIYELILEMQSVRRVAPLARLTLTSLTPGVGILPRDQTAPALGRGPAAVPPHARAGLPEARHLQARRRRGRSAGVRRQRDVLPAWRRPLARLGRARRPERQQAQPDDDRARERRGGPRAVL